MPCDEARSLRMTDRYSDDYLMRSVALTYSYTAPSDDRAYTIAGRESLLARKSNLLGDGG